MRNDSARRPRDAANGRLRRIRVGVNVSGTEFDLIEDHARARGLSVGAAARELILLSAVGERLRSREATALDRRLAHLAGRAE